MFAKIRNSLANTPVQTYVNVILVSIGLTADIISLAAFFGAINTPTTGSNFYVNSREFLAWVLLALVYSFGMINAYIRRRWRKKYSDRFGNHSVLNFFNMFGILDDPSKHLPGWRNFQRDFSFTYLIAFPVTFLYMRAVNASENATGVTPSPWGDVSSAFFVAIFVSIGLMILTSMFDFAFSMFKGDVRVQADYG